MRRHVWAAVSLAVLLSASPDAFAQERAVVLPLNTEPSIPQRARDQAVSALTGRLSAYGLDAVDGQVVPEALRTCRRGDCVREVREAVEAAVAVSIALWPAEGDPSEPGAVVVALIDERAVPFTGTVQLEDGDLASGVDQALQQATARRQVGPGPWLLVDGGPLGAIVALDGEVVGELPWHGRVEPGPHELEVRMAGVGEHTQTISVPDDPASDQRVEVHLGGGVSAFDPLPHAIAAGTLGGVGLGLLIADLVALATARCETALASGVCVRGQPLDEGTFAAYGVAGLVALAAGTVWLVVALGQDSGSPTISLGPGSIQLHGSF